MKGKGLPFIFGVATALVPKFPVKIPKRVVTHGG